MSNAIYPGSFDPITYGHIDIVRRATRLFDDLVIAVVANPRKKPLFSVTERVSIAEKALAECDICGVKVIEYDGLLIDCAKSHNVQAIVRGLRANSDFDYEFQMALTNRDLDSDIETVFFMTAGRYSFLSSSIVKEVKRFGGEIKSFVPKSVEQALAQKFELLAGN
ncbi:MAG: pantetheine-phosphate adenylyltransferase [Candidatus Bipolaricaulota bacterium]